MTCWYRAMRLTVPLFGPARSCAGIEVVWLCGLAEVLCLTRKAVTGSCHGVGTDPLPCLFAHVYQM
jgi:hypothetical protein